MKFGIFNIGDYHPESSKPIPDYYDQMLEQVEWAEKLGYDAYWFGEHHFDFFGVVPAPPVMMAAAAKRTHKIRLGVGVALLPYHNPITIAEEYAMVDILSRGRLDFGVGRGTPPELKGFGVTEDNRDKVVEALEVVKMAWRDSRIEFHGKYYNIPGVNLNITPVQKPWPPLYFAALSPGSYEVAAEKGYPILGIPYASCTDMADVKQKLAAYKDALATHGHDPKKIEIVECFHTHVAMDEKEADRNGRAGLVPYLTARKSIRPRDYDELYRQRMIMVGDPKHCAEHIAEVRAAGSNYVIFLMNFATLEQEKILASMEIMAKEVLPKFK